MATDGVLRPWYRALRRARASDDDEFYGDATTIWFTLGRNPMQQKTIAFTIEGVQLLAWLAQISVEQFDAVMSELWPTRIDGDDTSASSRRQVGLVVYTQGPGHDAVSACFLTRTGERRPSQKYVETSRILQQNLQDRGAAEDESLRRPNVPVQVILDGCDPACRRSLKCVADFVKAQNETREHDGQAHERWFHLRVATVDFNRSQYYVVDERRFAQLKTLVTHGVTVVACRQPQLHVATSTSARDTFLGVQTLFKTVAGDTTGGPGLGDLMVDLDYMVPDMAPRLCSAIAYSHSLRRLWVGVSDADAYAVLPPSRHVARWLGFALFSPLVRHDIDVVEFELAAHARDVLVAATDVLRVDDPLTVVFAQHAASVRANEHLRATASRFALLHPTSARTSDSATVDTGEHRNLRVISHDANWWSVLLPAWGQAWVHDCDIELTTIPVPLASRASRRRRLRVVEVAASGMGLGGLTFLVNQVGPAVARLKIDVPDVSRGFRELTTWPRVVLRSLPKRRVLQFAVKYPDQLDLLLDAFASFQLTRSLDQVELQIECQSTALPDRFVAALSDRTHPLAACLVALTVRDAWLAEHELWAVCDQLVEVLGRNTRLVSLDLDIGPRHVAQFEEVEHALMVHDRADLYHPVGLREKIAFLSVLWGRASGGSLHTGAAALQQLDSVVVAMIFQLAAWRRQRRVHVVLTRTQH